MAIYTYYSGEEPEGFQILQDVASFGSDEKDVHPFHGLVNVSHGVGFHEGMLFSSAGSSTRR